MGIMVAIYSELTRWLKNVNKQGAHSPGLVRDVYICMSMFTFYNPVALYGSWLVIGFILYPPSWWQALNQLIILFFSCLSWVIHKCILVHLFHIITVYIYRYTDICIIERYFFFAGVCPFRFAKTVTCMIKVPKDHIYKEKILSLPCRYLGKRKLN